MMRDTDEQALAALFDRLLDDADAHAVPLRTQARRAGERAAGVADDLALLAALREVAPLPREVEAARKRVGARLADALLAEVATPAKTVAAAPLTQATQATRATGAAGAARPRLRLVSQSEAPQPPVTRRAAHPLRRLALVAAILLAATGGLAGVSNAAAQALPESPLYGVKRAEESVSLTLARTDVGRGQVLGVIAQHRLGEAAAEADQRRGDEARSLLTQFDAALRQLITLTAQAQAHHEDTGPLTQVIQETLQDAQSAQRHAAQRGDTSFAQATQASMAAAGTQLQSAGVTLPSSAATDQPPRGGPGAATRTPGAKMTHTPGDGNGEGGKPVETPNPAAPGTASATPSTTPSTTPSVTPSPTATPGHGNGKGGGTGGGNVGANSSAGRGG